MEIKVSRLGDATVRFGEYGISNYDRGDRKLWIEHKGGEGMEVPEADLIEVLRKFYSDNF